MARAERRSGDKSKARSLAAAKARPAKPAAQKSRPAAPLKSSKPAKPAKPAAKPAPAKNGATKPVEAAPARSIRTTKSSKATGASIARLAKSSIAAPIPPKPPRGQITARNGADHADEAVSSKVPAKPMPKKARTELSAITLPANYRPADSEPFMNPKHRVYFRNKLLTWKEDILKQNRETLQVLHDDTFQHADLADRATSETDRALELRARDRQRKLIAKIDAALARIEDGSYGYCEETGEPISLKRLDARPIATLSLEAQERHERREKVYRED
jgi:DnaK suppressor protein